MNLKTRKLQIRLNKEELTYIKEHPANYCIMSHYIRNAINAYSDSSSVRQFQLIEALGLFFINNIDDSSQFSAKTTSTKLNTPNHPYLYNLRIPKTATPTNETIELK
ncbi:hypothetical protein HDR70_06580 [bacterium]|nr:hypothetical protein [bacterium]